MSGLPPVSETRASDLPLATTSPSSQPSKRQRVLACTLCSQRKVKCDRRFPCANCIKSRSQCVPATLAPRQRRRRFTERTLLDRLHQYEDLLRQNNIPFEPLQSTRRGDLNHADNGDDSEDERMGNAGPDASTSSTTAKSETGHGVKNVFHTMSHGYRDPDNDSDSSLDDLREMTVKRAWDHEIEKDQHLLFGSRGNIDDLSKLHPDPVQIFRLWQIYVENVNPLLKVTHIPSLQARVIEAASDLAHINVTLEALMFSIYCIATLTLTVEDCQTMFGSPKEDLLSRYQTGCQEALWKCGFLRTNDRDCLTALFLYLISVRPNTVPRSLSSMLGVAIRIAQGIGIHNEADLAKCTVFEAEMRRRLWWPLMLFDTRMSQLGSSKALTLDPTWTCKVPLNVNDTDLRPEMKVPPTVRREPTEAIFVVVRSELAEFLRHTTFHLEFGNTALKALAKHVNDSLASDSGHLDKLGEMIEDRYLKFCDRDNPIHFMAIWTTRALLAKYHLLAHNLSMSASSTRRGKASYDAATATAIKLLECDTKVMTAPLTKGFSWLNQINFPFPAYYQIAQDLRRRPHCGLAQQAWDVMSDSWEAWFNVYFSNDDPIFELLPKFLLPSWEAYEVNPAPPGQILTTPRIISSIRYALAQKAELEQHTAMQGASNTVDMETNEFPLSMSMQMPATLPSHNLPYGMEMQEDYAWTTQGMSSTSGPPAQDALEIQMNQIDWTGFGGWPAW